MKAFWLTLLCVGIMNFLPGGLKAQWEPDVRLTNDPATSSTSRNNAWCIAASGNIVHVVWYDNRDGNYEIYYKRSTNRGESWGPDTRLTTNTASSTDPCIAVSGSAVHIVWVEYRDGNNEIYYKRSSDGGITWGPDTRLTNDYYQSLYPSVAASGSAVHVVWQNGSPSAVRLYYMHSTVRLYYMRSTDGGLTWETNTELSSSDGEYPCVAVSGSILHVVWLRLLGGFFVGYKRSTDGGVTWQADTTLVRGTGFSWNPSVAISGSLVHVVWEDTRNGSSEIYYKRSSDGGVNWGVDTRLTNNTVFNYSAQPSVAASGSAVHVVWYDTRAGDTELYYKRSTDGGLNWEADNRLTYQPYNSWYPSIAVSGSAVHVVWNDGRQGGYEIYYKRNPSGNPTAVDLLDSKIPQDFKIEQNYPNPFNPSTHIPFSVQGSALTSLKVYDILGREVATLVNEVKQPGRYEVTWNATGYASGVYFYRLKAGSFVQTKRMLLLR